MTFGLHFELIGLQRVRVTFTDAIFVVVWRLAGCVLVHTLSLSALGGRWAWAFVLHGVVLLGRGSDVMFLFSDTLSL